jgi:hypothetical protein
MSVPNSGPEIPDPKDPDGTEPPRRGNPAPLYRDEPRIDDVEAATTRASTVSHRFGGVRYALSRPVPPAPAEPGDEARDEPGDEESGPEPADDGERDR